TPMTQSSAGYPSTTTYPSTSSYPAPTQQVALEYGRVTGIEVVPAGVSPTAGARSPNVLGAVVGGVAGAVLGHQIGGGRGRDAATVLGGVAGAAAGSQVGGARTQPAPATASNVPTYRVNIQTDQGVLRVYEVTATGDLRVGDRVRVENGVIYRA
ncbi:MAG TPA: glycine zipper 2TM domain-containing protein, partial [Ramlibacter sp.]|nr:glycine zipper 2TM domain-containing protein [Ramlibacter sp.]